MQYLSVHNIHIKLIIIILTLKQDPFVSVPSVQYLVLLLSKDQALLNLRFQACMCLYDVISQVVS